MASSVGWWRSEYNEDFEVIHDQSTHFFYRKNLWDRMTDMSASNGVIHVGHKTIRFPLRVRTTRPGNSAQLAPLQICDLIGGFVAKTKSPKLSNEERKVLDKMMNAGLGEIAFDSITPGYDFVDGPPSESDGLDAVDQVIRLVYIKREL